MQLDFNQIFISKEEFNFFLTLNMQERIDYLFGLYESYSKSENMNVDLTDFFRSVAASLESKQEPTADELLSKTNPDAKMHQVSVMIDEDNIMIEADSLRAIRIVANKFMQSGYILQRDKKTEKMFQKDKITKYMRIFHIVDQISGICFN
jgi:hypothetical protein